LYTIMFPAILVISADMEILPCAKCSIPAT
jgi:hypothetical protein